MKLSHSKFVIPPDLVAPFPAEDKDKARLMVLDRKKQTIEHKKFEDILDYFGDEDVIVRNDTKVFPALLTGQKEKTTAPISVFLLRELEAESRLWDVLVDPARKIRIGNRLFFGDDDLSAEVIDNTTSRGRTIRFLFDGTYEEFKKKITEMGETPIPDAIQRLRDIVPEDKHLYQTVYAKHEGAVVAPTAGLHFTKNLLKRLELKGVTFADITLHASVGSFRLIDVEDLGKHKIDSEEFMISEEAANIINSAKSKGRKVCAIGTTSVKALESSIYSSGLIKPYEGWTNKFIFPPYNITSVDAMLTNFHPSQSAMFMMVCAFGGFSLIKEAYKQAIANRYHFLTYGDAMLIV
jgi:S-adenosylmethionine:tRNA ribosyltransferase-isomerase